MFKKWSRYLLMVLLFLVFIPGTSLGAEESYPLEDGEIILDSRQVDGGAVELLTEKGESYFIKKYVHTKEVWVLTDSRDFLMRKTGLLIDESIPKRSRAMDRALEQRLRSRGVDVNTLPAWLSYEENPCLPPVGDQGNQGSCAAWASTYYLRTFQQAKDIEWQVKEHDEGIAKHILSPSFVYNQINEGEDKGASFPEAAKLLQDKGTVSLRDFPYYPADFLRQPSSELIARAYPHRIRQGMPLCTKDDSPASMVQIIKEYLNSGDLVAAGGKVWLSFCEPVSYNGETVIVTDNNNYTWGGHAYLIVGYDDTIETPEGRGAFRIVNSWGKEWGDKGFAYISYPAFTQNLILAYVFTDLLNGPIACDIYDYDVVMIDSCTMQFRWEESLHADGYKVLDQNMNDIDTVCDNEYILKLERPGPVTLYIQPFNEISAAWPLCLEADTSFLQAAVLPFIVENAVDFEIECSTEGKYDLMIKDIDDNIVYNEQDLQLRNGLNGIRWNGKNMHGQILSDGNYRLYISNHQEEDSYILKFNKEAALETVKPKVYISDGKIESIHIPIRTKSAGILNIKICSPADCIELVNNDELATDQEKEYLIEWLDYDFSTANFDELYLEITFK